MLRYQSLLRISSVLFMVQSGAWLLFSFLCILCIEGAIGINSFEDSYSAYLLHILYQIFFTKDLDHTDTYMVVKPRVFEAFAFIHLFLAISWFTLSAIVYNRTTTRRIQKLQNNSILKSWLIIGYLVAFVDGIFTILLMVDMIETTRINGFLISSQIMPAISLVFIIVSRGFTLWILNVTFIVKLTRGLWVGPKMYRENDYDTRYSNQYGGNAYGNAYVNSGYQPTSAPVTQQSQYIYPPAAQQQGGARMAPGHQDHETPYRQAGPGYPTNSPAYPVAAAVSPYAQINRNPSPPGQRSPLARLHAVSPPQIPEPDYQREPRTVLKNRSQYDRY